MSKHKGVNATVQAANRTTFCNNYFADKNFLSYFCELP